MIHVQKCTCIVVFTSKEGKMRGLSLCPECRVKRDMWHEVKCSQVGQVWTGTKLEIKRVERKYNIVKRRMNRSATCKKS